MYRTEEYDHMVALSNTVYGIVESKAKERGFQLVDTKLEFGKDNQGKIYIADEICTLDSSRFWRIDEKGEVLYDSKGEPISHSKEIARQFVKSPKQQLTPSEIKVVSVIYMLTVERLLDRQIDWDESSSTDTMLKDTKHALAYLGIAYMN